jgi:hypothetical protein
VLPTTAHERGDPHVTAQRAYRPFDEALWCWKAPRSGSEDLDVHLRDIARAIDGASIARFAASGISAEILIGVFMDDSEPADIVLPQDMLNYLASSGVVLKLAIYPYFDVAT